MSLCRRRPSCGVTAFPLSVARRVDTMALRGWAGIRSIKNDPRDESPDLLNFVVASAGDHIASMGRVVNGEALVTWISGLV